MTSDESALHGAAVHAIRASCLVVLFGTSWHLFVDGSRSPSVVFWSAVVALVATFVVRYVPAKIRAGEPY